MDWNDAYTNAKYIPSAADFPPRWRAEAAEFRARLGERARIGLCYGADPRQAFDLFMPQGAPLGMMVFIHGGFWRAFDRGDWSHLAAGALARGWAVAMPGYRLAPVARISEMTREIAVAVVAAAQAVGGDLPIVATGHSAGGHLSARLACRDVVLPVSGRIRRVVPISPLSDLRPMMLTTMNDDFCLTEAEARAESPMLLERQADIGAHVWVGGAERPAFLDQARWLSDAWACPLSVAEGRHHFDVIDALCDPSSALMDVLLAADG